MMYGKMSKKRAGGKCMSKGMDGKMMKYGEGGYNKAMCEKFGFGLENPKRSAFRNAPKGNAKPTK
jgi:hypothetical protein